MLEMRRVPTVAVCTHGFLAGGRMQAESLRMPDVPIITVPQEYITHTPDEVRILAEARVEEVRQHLLLT